MEDRELLKRALAETQAREAKLRTAVKRSLHNGSNTLLYEVVLLPSDDSVLHEMIEAAKAEEREACAQEAERQAQDEPYGHAKFRCTNIAAEIRARKRAQ